MVHNYVLAVLNKDYQKAYGYLADLENKPTYEEFRQSFFNGMVNPGDVGVEVGSVEINGDEAVVTLSVYYSNQRPVFQPLCQRRPRSAGETETARGS